MYLFQTDVGSKSTFAKTSSFLLCSIYIGPLDLSRNSYDIKLDGKSNVHVKCKVERQHSKAYPCNTCWWTSNYNNLLYLVLFSMPTPPNNHTKKVVSLWSPTFLNVDLENHFLSPTCKFSKEQTSLQHFELLLLANLKLLSASP